MINFSGRLLHAFLTLAECRHFTLAAQRCHVSQSAFSQMITRLERDVGAKLFDRNTRNVSLTPEGELFAQAAQRLAADIQATLGNLRDHAAQRKGKVAIAALPSLAAEWLPAIIAVYRRRSPGVALQLFDIVSARALAMVREGTVDFALTAAGDLREFETRLLFTEPFYLVCRKDHSLARRKHVSLRDLEGVEFVHSVRTGSIRQRVDPALRDAGIAVIDTGLEIEQLAPLAAMVGIGLGVTLIPELALAEFRRKGLAVVRVSDRSLFRPVYLVKQRGRSLSAAAKAMLELIEERRLRAR